MSDSDSPRISRPQQQRTESQQHSLSFMSRLCLDTTIGMALGLLSAPLLIELLSTFAVSVELPHIFFGSVLVSTAVSITLSFFRKRRLKKFEKIH